MSRWSRSLAVAALADRAQKPAGQERRPLYADGRWQDAQVLDRSSLEAGDRVEGPAIIGQFDATTVLEPGATATVDAVGNLRIQVGRAR